MGARAWIGMALGAVLVAGCATGSGGGSGTGWPEGTSTDLVPSGLTLVGGTGEGDVVVDGAGMVWVDGPWQVARVDPATGQSTIWDAADDLAFTTVRGLAPAQPSGVWLDGGDRVRLFDGQRFLVDIAVPAQYADVPDGEGPAGEVLQVGGELWASGVGGVGRWVDGSWSSVGAEQLFEAGPLAVDSAGAVWAGAVSRAEGGDHNVVVRFDGTAWTTPGNADVAPTGGVGDIAADPSGGVWVASTQDGPTTDQHGIYRFDGTTWSKAGPGGYAHDMAVTTGGQLWAMVGAGNGIDPSGEVRVARLAADGTWEAFGSGEGAPEGSEGFWPSLAVTGDTVIVSEFAGLVRGEGDRFVTLWQDPAAVVQPGFEVAYGQVSDAVVAVSAGEAWLPAAPMSGGGVPWLATATALSRYRDGTWQAVGPATGGDMDDPAVLATDGAIWQATFQGLVRIEGDDWMVVADDIGGDLRPSLAAADDGSVWTIHDGDVLRVDPDGSRTSIGRPDGSRPLFVGAPLAAGNGAVWTTDADPRHELSQLLTWDGQWSTVSVPEQYSEVTELLVAPDAALWATLDVEDEGPALARYADGRWTIDQGRARGLAHTPAGEVCAIRDAGVVCYDDAGLATGTPVSLAPLGVKSLGIAPDGAAWVLGEQVARLPEGSTGGGG